MKKILNVLLFAVMLSTGGMLFVGCSSDESPDVSDNTDNGVVASNPLADAAKQIDQNMADLDFSELEGLGVAAETRTRGAGDDSEVSRLVSELVALLRGDKGATLSGGRRFSYQGFNDVLSLSFELSGRLELNRESDASFLSKYTKGEGEVSYTTADGDQYTVVGMTEKDVSLKSWSINVEKGSELTIYKNEVLLLGLKAYVTADGPVWLPLLIRGNSFIGELTYHGYVVALGYDRENSHRRSVTLNYRKADSEMSLIDMTMQLEDNASIHRIVTHNVNIEADFDVNALEGLFKLTGHSSNVNYLIVRSKAIVDCLRDGVTDESSCQQLADELNDNLTLSLGLYREELGNLFFAPLYVEKKGCWVPALVIDLPQYGGRMVVNDLLESFGVDLAEVLSNIAD